MKPKRVIIVFSIAICAIAFTAFSIYPSKPDEEKTKKEQTAVVSNNEVEEESDAPCACSKFKCSKGHALEYSVMAYKKYSGKNCFYCNGSGKQSDNTKCIYCDGDGKDWSWQSGCVCKKCGEYIEQPNDC